MSEEQAEHIRRLEQRVILLEQELDDLKAHITEAFQMIRNAQRQVESERDTYFRSKLEEQVPLTVSRSVDNLRDQILEYIRADLGNKSGREVLEAYERAQAINPALTLSKFTEQHNIQHRYRALITERRRLKDKSTKTTKKG